MQFLSIGYGVDHTRGSIVAQKSEQFGRGETDMPVPGRAVELVAETAARLIEAVRDLPVAAVEGSFKMSPRLLLSNRLMIGVSRDAVTDQAILARIAALGVPSEFLEPMTSGLAAANLVLFGFEDGTSDCIYKFYLEYWDHLSEAVKAGNLAPALLHLGFKWGASTGARVAITQYHCYPMISWERVIERIRLFHAGADSRQPLAAVEAILSAAMSRSETPVYLEAEEDESPRRSYDVNIYAADLKIREVRAELVAARDHFAIATAPFDRLMATIGDSTLGHISGGQGRTGEDFLTFYYDVG